MLLMKLESSKLVLFLSRRLKTDDVVFSWGIVQIMIQKRTCSLFEFVCIVHLGAKYLVIVSSCSLKMREFSFAQFDNFLRKMCLFFNF